MRSGSARRMTLRTRHGIARPSGRWTRLQWAITWASPISWRMRRAPNGHSRTRTGNAFRHCASNTTRRVSFTDTSAHSNCSDVASSFTGRRAERCKCDYIPGTPKDAAACGLIDFEAFKTLAGHHNFPWDFPSPEVATTVVTMILSNPGFYAVVAELDSKIVGSNFLDERNPIAGIGPISVDPAVQNQTIGRQLMLAVMERATERRFAGTRLVQAAYHNRSLCLYTKLGFETREPLSKMDGAPLQTKFPGYDVRPATERDAPACNK